MDAAQDPDEKTVRAGPALGIGPTELARMFGISRMRRVYQIRDGRR